MREHCLVCTYLGLTLYQRPLEWHQMGKTQKITDKLITPLEPLEDPDDSAVWNSYLAKQEETSANISWYSGAWLWVECYMYRRIHQAINSVPSLR